MDTLYSWTIVRSGATMTIDHSCGKITGVVRIEPLDGQIVATLIAGKRFILSLGSSQ